MIVTDNSAISLIHDLHRFQCDTPQRCQMVGEERLERGLWRSDTVAGTRYPPIDVHDELVMVYALHQPSTQATVKRGQGGRQDWTGRRERLGRAVLCITKLFDAECVIRRTVSEVDWTGDPATRRPGDTPPEQWRNTSFIVIKAWEQASSC